MVLELGKFISFLFCILSLCAVFHAAFLIPAAPLEERIIESLKMLVFAGGICWASGWIFRAWERRVGIRSSGICSTLPVKMFLGAAGAILILFLVSWYLETYYLPLRSALHG